MCIGHSQKDWGGVGCLSGMLVAAVFLQCAHLCIFHCKRVVAAIFPQLVSATAPQCCHSLLRWQHRWLINRMATCPAFFAIMNINLH